MKTTAHSRESVGRPRFSGWASVLFLLGVVALTSWPVVGRSVSQNAQAPNPNITALAPQRHSPPGQRQPLPPGSTAPQPSLKAPGNGTIEGSCIGTRVSYHTSLPAIAREGKYKLIANSGLMPGEYGVVLRPPSKEKKFSGGGVARAQGDGLMFDAIWTFQISEEAE